MASDRIFGLVIFGVALAYIASAFQIQASFLSDPVGSKSFPILIGAVTMISALVLIVKPDPDPDWPASRTFMLLGIAVLTLLEVPVRAIAEGHSQLSDQPSAGSCTG